jgi:hypothetical protein
MFVIWISGCGIYKLTDNFQKFDGFLNLAICYNEFMVETTEPTPPEKTPPIPKTPAPTPAPDPEAEREKRQMKIMLTVAGILLVIFVIGGITLLMMAPGETTSKVRDVFIIFMALESLVIGVALVILVVQLATLINLLNNEIRPIIRSTNDTVNTLKGTVVFLSDNLSEPVIKLNETIAALRKFFSIIRPGRP